MYFTGTADTGNPTAPLQWPRWLSLSIRHRIVQTDTYDSRNKLNLYQILQLVAATIISSTLIGIYNNYNESTKMSGVVATQTVKQLADLSSQMQVIQEKVNGVPTIQSDLVALKVQNLELQRRVSDLEHRVHP